MTPEVNSTPEISILYVEDEPDTREILTTLSTRIIYEQVQINVLGSKSS